MAKYACVRQGLVTALIIQALAGPACAQVVADGSPTQTAAPDTDLVADGSLQQHAEPKFSSKLLAGRVVWLADALKSEWGVSTVPEVSENVIALLTDDGQLIPIAENLRGRAFRKDERLRNTPVEILARVYEKQPFIQILRVFEITDGQRFEIDYWCDVCAIVMYETGPCACCQDHNRLRKTVFEEAIEEVRE